MKLKNLGEEVRVKVRIRNNILYQAILKARPSVNSFCCDRGFSQSEVGKLLYLKASPFRKGTDKYKSMCKRLAFWLGYSPLDLFPPGLYKLRFDDIDLGFPISKVEFEKFMQTPILLNPLENAIDRELAHKTEKAMSAVLTPREQEITEIFYGIDVEYDLNKAEIARQLGITRERVRQLEEKAIKKLRRSKLGRELRPYKK